MSETEAPARRKGDKRQRTRAALLEAARQLIREQGHEKTTLAAVAARAGMTTGAIYGNFRNREELFVALGQAYWPAVRPKIRPDSTFAEKMRAFAEAAIAALPDRRTAVYGRLTGLAHTVAHEEMAAKVREVTAQSYAWGASWLRSLPEADDLPMPAEVLVVVIHALTEGLTFQRLVTPELVPDEVFYEAFAALARTPTPATGRPPPEVR